MRARILVTFATLALVSEGRAAADSAALPLTPAPAAETVLGEKEVERFLGARRLSGDGVVALRVERIGQALARVSDRPDLVYTFLVVEGSQPQAYSFTGGTVCLTEGLARLYTSDDELAFAIAHELAHVALRHVVLEGVFEQALEAGRAGDPVAARGLYGQASELEADRYGALYACRAGYKFTAAMDALDRLDRTGDTQQADARHPAYAERIEVLQRMKAELERSLEAFGRGKSALVAGRVDEAVDMLKLFTASFPQSVAGHVNLGSAFLARARSTGGVPGGLEEVVPFLPDPGVVVRGSSPGPDVQRAREHFRKALELRPDDPVAALGLGVSLLRLGDFVGARSALERVAEKTRSDPEFVLVLGNVELLGGTAARAAELYADALRLRPDWPAARKNLALAREANGEALEARKLWEGLIADPKIGPEAKRRSEGRP
jgi:predicted Zn-dependent protease